jgi:hypothetical protein
MSAPVCVFCSSSIASLYDVFVVGEMRSLPETGLDFEDADKITISVSYNDGCNDLLKFKTSIYSSKLEVHGEIL